MALFPIQSSAAGATISVSTTAPATHDAAGWGAISAGDWKEIGRVTTPAIPRGTRSYGDVKTLDGNSFPTIGSETMAEVEVGCVFEETDVGQAVIDANSSGSTLLYFKVELVSGYKVYYAAYVTGYSPYIEGDVDTGYVAATFTVKAVYGSNKVGVVRVAP